MSVGRTGRTRLLGPGWTARVSQWMMRSQVKSVQRATLLGNATATITAVVMANSRLRYLGHINNNDTQDLDYVLLTFTNPTTITATTTTVGGGVSVSFEVIEYQPGVIKSVQRGTIGANTTAAITAVDVKKSELDHLGTTNTEAFTGDYAHGLIVLTNATTITSIVAIGANVITGYQVIEWF